MRTLAKYNAKAYSVHYETGNAFKDEHRPGSSQGNARKNPPRAPKRLRNSGRSSIRAISRPFRGAAGGR